MSDLRLKSCPICMESIPFERVLFLLCGHKICNVCVSKCEAKCVVCRKPIPADTPHRIYLNMEEIEDNRRYQTIDGINSINAKSGVADVEKACSSMEKLVTTAETDLPNTEGILEAIESMKERIAPVFQQLEILLEENKSLQEELKKSNERYEASKVKLRKASEKAEAQLKEKSDILERYKFSYQKTKKELEESQNTVAENQKKINALRTKMKALLKQQNRRSSRSSVNHAGDASLQIGEQLPEDAQQIPSKRASDSSRLDVNQDHHHHTKRKKDTIIYKK